MQLKKENRIDLIISKDSTRPHMCNAYLDLDGPSPVLVATDGERLVRLPVGGCNGDSTGAITVDALKAGRKTCKKGDEMVITANQSLDVLDGPTFDRPKDCNFPPYQKVIPAEGTNTHRIGLNAKYLWEIVQALGAQDDAGVVLEFSGKLDPIVVKRTVDNGELGVLMPVRV